MKVLKRESIKDHLDDEAEWEGKGDDDEEDGGEDEEVGAHLW